MITLQRGKFPPKKDSRNLKFTKYLKERVTLPDVVSWYDFKPVSDWGMKGNDMHGNCVIVTASHIIDSCRANESHNFTRISDSEVKALSADMRALDGYYVLDRLKTWKNKGMWGSYINAFVDIEPIEHYELQAAIYIFGHADIGLQMPAAWDHSTLWHVGIGENYNNMRGGHSIPLLGYCYDKKRGLIYYGVSWGRVVEITAAAINRYCDEAYVSVVRDWFAVDQFTPSGWAADKLDEDLRNLD